MDFHAWEQWGDGDGSFRVEVKGRDHLESTESAADGRPQQGHYRALFVELDFHLCGVDVDVHTGRVYLEEEDIEGQGVRGKQADEAVANGPVQGGVADEAPVDE